MKIAHYEVEYKPLIQCGRGWYPDDEFGYDGRRRYRSASAALKRADQLKEQWEIEATRVVKVTREPISRRKIKQGDF